MTPPRVIFVVGPTASGKTSLAIELALALDGELVNADSVQVYRGFDIGSCKPTADEQAQARHHLIDILDPHENFDAGRFVALADTAIAEIRAAGRVPIVVGGTGLYLRALQHGLAALPLVTPAVRAAIQDELRAQGVEALHALLGKVDPEAANRIAPQDPQRVTRALEVYRQTGIPISDHIARHRFAERRYDPLVLALDWPREALYRRIDTRVGALMEEGFPEEVQRLLAAGVSPLARPMQSLGYAELVQMLQGEMSVEEATEHIRRGHRRYAKRQLTWFRKVPDTVWLSPDRARADAIERACRHRDSDRAVAKSGPSAPPAGPRS